VNRGDYFVALSIYDLNYMNTTEETSY